MPNDIAESAAQEETGFALPSQQQKFSGGSSPPQGASSAPEGAGRKMGNPPFSTLHSMLML